MMLLTRGNSPIPCWEWKEMEGWREERGRRGGGRREEVEGGGGGMEGSYVWVKKEVLVFEE